MISQLSSLAVIRDAERLKRSKAGAWLDCDFVPTKAEERLSRHDGKIQGDAKQTVAGVGVFFSASLSIFFFQHN